MNVLGSKKIGYALGGGAARGLSHIGVLKVFDEYKISPDLIVGTSMGALVGALYASGLKAIDIEQIVLRLNWKQLVRLADITLPISGIIQGKRVISLLKSIIGDLTFSRLKYDFACVATDISNGGQVVMHDGSLIDAVRASISIPGIFTPVVLDGRYLVDGGLVNEVPVSVCRVMGAEYVIGINVLPEPSRIMCNPKKGRNYPACELIRLGEIRNKNEPLIESAEHSHSLQFRIANIENAIKTFVNHQAKEQRHDLKSIESGKTLKTKRSKTKAPSVLDILTQTLIIAEYRVAIDNLKDADMAISPEVEDVGFWQFTKSIQAISAGETAARQVLQHSKLINIV
jgi:NTE family protein